MNDLAAYYGIALALGFTWALWPRKPHRGNRRLTRVEAWMERWAR